MVEFSVTDLGARTDEMLAAASQEPVSILQNGKAGFVILTMETYERLRVAADPRIARRTADIPVDEGEALIAELARIVDSGE